MTQTLDVKLSAAHRRSATHRDEVFSSEICGCFYCLNTFPPDAIAEWVDAVERDSPPQTALCPYCGVDSVLGSASGFPIDRDFLSMMRARYFGNL